VFTVPASAWRDSGIVMATLADSLPIVPDGGEATMVTDASISDTRLAVRTYERLYVFALAGAGAPGRLLAACSLAPLDERQGEGLAWLPDGRVLLTSEKQGAPIIAARCG
jgi:hypothetical protein